VKTRLAEPAKLQARKMHRWWRKNRLKSPKLFALELREVRRRIAEKPDLGQIFAVRRGGVIVRRILMEQTRTHVFYEILESQSTIMIVTLWGAVKGTDPDLDLE
jgi:hypothetical protein